MADTLQSPIIYPKITVPGKGTYTVKFGLSATRAAEIATGLSPAELMAKLQSFFPEKDEFGNVIRPGRFSVVLLTDLLSACIWEEARLTAEDLCKCFDEFYNLEPIAAAVVEAISKTQWSRQLQLREAATNTEQPAIPLQ